MKYRKQIILGIIVLLVIVLTIFFQSSDENIVKLGFCDIAGSTCTYYFVIGVLKPLLVCSLALLLTLVLVFFIQELTYLAWRKFALWAIPIGAIILFLAPTDDPSHVLGPDLTKQTASWGVSILFFLISLIIIVSKSIRLEKTR